MPEDDLHEQLAAARRAGIEAARACIDNAPTEPLLRVAWLKGHNQVDELPAAIAAARAEGSTWPDIAAALDEYAPTVKNKYGGGNERQRRYRERKRSEG